MLSKANIQRANKDIKMTTYLKKTSTLALLFISVTAMAGTMRPVVVDEFNPKENVYLGVGIGASINNDRFTATDVTNNNAVHASSNNTNAQGNVFLGYGHTFSNALYLGAEANIYTPRIAKFNNRPGVEFTTTLLNEKYTIDDYLAVDLLPGYRVNSNILVYGRVGMSFRNTNFNEQPVTDPVQNIADSTNSVDGRFGVGVTYALTKKFAASVDYFYSYAPTFGTYSPMTPPAQFAFKSSSNYVGVSLVYTA